MRAALNDANVLMVKQVLLRHERTLMGFLNPFESILNQMLLIKCKIFLLL